MEDLKNKAIRLVEETVEQLNRMYGTDMKMPEIRFVDLGSDIAGTAQCSLHTVNFHPGFMKHPDFWDKTKAATIQHEVAHLFVHKFFRNAKQHHGPEFRRVMASLGANGSTYHRMGKVETKKRTRTVTRHEYGCGCEGAVHKVTTTIHNRIIAGRGRICCACKQRIYKL